MWLNVCNICLCRHTYFWVMKSICICSGRLISLSWITFIMTHGKDLGIGQHNSNHTEDIARCLHPIILQILQGWWLLDIAIRVCKRGWPHTCWCHNYWYQLLIHVFSCCLYFVCPGTWKWTWTQLLWCGHFLIVFKPFGQASKYVSIWLFPHQLSLCPKPGRDYCSFHIFNVAEMFWVTHSSKLLFMMKVMTWQFVMNTHKVMTVFIVMLSS
jgi:hypothetical protein